MDSFSIRGTGRVDVATTEAAAIRHVMENQPFNRLFGIEVLDAGPGWVRERLGIRPDFLQPTVVHGGIIYTLADTAAAHSLLTLILPDAWAATVEQKINFLRPVTGDEIVCHAKVCHRGKTLAYAEAEVVDGEGKLVAKSTATIMRLEQKP